MVPVEEETQKACYFFLLLLLLFRVIETYSIQRETLYLSPSVTTVEAIVLHLHLCTRAEAVYVFVHLSVLNGIASAFANSSYNYYYCRRFFHSRTPRRLSVFVILAPSVS